MAKGVLAGRRSKVERQVARGMVRLRRVKRDVLMPRVALVTDAVRRSGAATVDGLTPEAATYARRNFRLGVMNGILFTLVDGLISPTLVLAWFVSRLGGSNVLVGMLPAIVSGGWLLPQMIVASRVQGLTRVMHWYSRIGVMRTLCMLALTATTLLLAAAPALLLILFFFFYTVYALAAGVSGIPWLEMVGKVVAPRRRGSFFGHRNFWGGLLALLLAAPVGAVLSEKFLGLTFPYNFGLLFGVTTLVVGGGVWSWSAIKEPAGTALAPGVTLRTLVSYGVAAVKSDRDYRLFMIVRILLSLATIADPFYIVYVKDKLGAPAAIVGLYLGALSIASLLSNLVWSPLSDRASNRTLMLCAAGAVLLVPFGALVISLLVGVLPDTLLFSVFAVVFVLSGFALGGSRIVSNNMLLSIAPPAQRATYIGLLNTVLGIVIFVPVLGGVVVDAVGFVTVFVVALVVAAIGVIFSLRMSNKKPA